MPVAIAFDGAGSDDHHVGHRAVGDFAHLLDQVVALDHDPAIRAEFDRALGARMKKVRADDRTGAEMPRELHVHHAHDAETDDQN